MIWTPMHGQTWLDAAAVFVAMWTPMMAVMMTPVLAPMLWRYARALSAAGQTRLAAPIGVAGAGYLLVWTGLGLVVFPLGAALATIQSHLAPPSQLTSIATGMILMLAGALQFTPWKARLLACCRETPSGCSLLANATSAWRYGLRFGLHCTYCCAGFTAILLIVGMMDLRAMVLVTAAIAVERLAPRGERAAKVVGAIVVLIGAGWIAVEVGR